MKLLTEVLEIVITGLISAALGFVSGVKVAQTSKTSSASAAAVESSVDVRTNVPNVVRPCTCGTVTNVVTKEVTP